MTSDQGGPTELQSALGEPGDLLRSDRWYRVLARVDDVTVLAIPVSWEWSTRCEFCGEILREDDPWGGLCEGCMQDEDLPGSDPMGYLPRDIP